MKIKCPKCKEKAELAADFSLVTCKKCDFEMSYGEYVRYVAHADSTYSDILSDYTGSTEGEKAGTLDEWD
jgi:ribosomal protein L37AE/L43A